MMHHLKQTGMAVTLMVGLSMSAVASASSIGDCVLTGYTFMGGGNAYTSTPAGPNAKDYFTASSLNWDFNGQNMWGYGWAKFDNLSATPVTQASVTFDVFAIGAMSPTPPSPGSPAILSIYDPGTIDVADLGGSVALRGTLRDNLDAGGTVLGSLTMTAAGSYSIDITDLYNSWVANPHDNHGLVFVGPNDGNASRYAGFSSNDGAAPTITSIPEPATLCLLAVGGVAALRRRRAA